MRCSKCNKEKVIVNKFFTLCSECNNERLHGNKFGKTYTKIQSKIQPLKTAKTKLKSKGRVSISAPKIQLKNQGVTSYELDNLFYEECFNLSDHKCEECGCQLPEEFKNEQGKVNARWRYSHIIPKSIAPEIRRDTNNINHLCLLHHSEWENGDKEKMAIYSKNVLRLPKYFN